MTMIMVVSGRAPIGPSCGRMRAGISAKVTSATAGRMCAGSRNRVTTAAKASRVSGIRMMPTVVMNRGSTTLDTMTNSAASTTRTTGVLLNRRRVESNIGRLG